MKKLLILFLSTLACTGLCSYGTKKTSSESDNPIKITTTEKSSEPTTAKGNGGFHFQVIETIAGV